MLNINKSTVEAYKKMNIPFTLLSQEKGSKNLAIMLPGAGYTAQAPLFHYSTENFLNRSFDVLEVNYRYNDEAYDDFSMEEISEAIKFDVKTVLDKVLIENSYEDFYIIGKSLGTIALSSELTRNEFRDAKAVWLTPLIQRDDVLDAMAGSKHQGLCFIGDEDRCYIEERYKQVKNNSNIVSSLIPGADHSLELKEDVLGSIDVLKDIIRAIEAF